MALPVLEATLATDSAAVVSSINVNRVTGIVNGELLLLTATSDSPSSTQQFSNNVTGWNFIGQAGTNVADAHIAAWWRIADGTEPSTVNVAATDANDMTGHYTRISGAHATTPINASNFVASTTTPATHTIPEVTTNVIDCLAIYGLSFDGGDGAPFSVSGAGWVEADEIVSTGSAAASSNASTIGARDVAAIGGTTGAGVLCSTNDGAAYFQIAIAPSTGATTVNVTTDTLSITTYTASVNLDITVAVTTDVLVLTEYPVNLTVDSNINVTSVALSLTEAAASISLSVEVSATTDVLALTEYSASLGQDTNISAGFEVLVIAEGVVTLTYDKNVLATTDALAISTYAAFVSTGVAITDYDILTGNQMLATKQDTAFPIELVVDSSGGVTGLSVTAAIRDTTDSSSYLDFNDNTFKASGWTTKELALTDLTGGFYGTTLDITAITNLPAGKSLAVEFAISGTVTAAASSFLTFLDDYLTTGKFIGLS